MRRRRATRAQSNVVGVALLLGIAVVSMGTLTAAVGLLVDSSVAEADADRVANDLDDALEPVVSTGPQRGSVTFGNGQLHSVERSMEIRVDGAVIERINVDALVFESGDRRVAFHTGAIVRGSTEQAWIEQPPPITADDEILIVGAPRIGDGVRSISGTEGVTATIETDVSHDRRELGDAEFTVATETTTPNAWERQFEELGASVAREAGDPPVVVATFDGERTGYLVVHDLDTEVYGRG